MRSIKRFLCILSLLCLDLVHLSADTRALSGRLGFGMNGLLPITGEYGVLGLVLDSRFGGTASYTPFELGTAHVGIEVGAWLAYLPIPDNPILMLESPIAVDAVFDLGAPFALESGVGYCLMVGKGAQTELTHAATLNVRLRSSWWFLECGGYLPIFSDGQAVDGLSMVPHLAMGWQF